MYIKNSISFSLSRWIFTPTQDEMNLIKEKFGNNFVIPQNFVKTAPGHTGGVINRNGKQSQAQCNPQTRSFCEKLGIDDPLALILTESNHSVSSLLEESNIDDSDNTSFTDDLDVTNRSVDSVNSSMRTRLSLPEPKSDNYDSSICDISLTDLKEECNESANLSDDVIPDYVGSNLPRAKKFIRRNAKMYGEDNSF